jgi:hypothetical protein
MPRYFFHLHNGTAACDEEGRELPDLNAARAEAITTAREMMRDDIRAGRLPLGHRIEIHGADGTNLLTVRFDEAVTLEY